MTNPEEEYENLPRGKDHPHREYYGIEALAHKAPGRSWFTPPPSNRGFSVNDEVYFPLDPADAEFVNKCKPEVVSDLIFELRLLRQLVGLYHDQLAASPRIVVVEENGSVAQWESEGGS